MNGIEKTILRTLTLVIAALMICVCSSCNKSKDQTAADITPSAPGVATNGVMTEHTTPVQTETNVPEVTPEPPLDTSGPVETTTPETSSPVTNAPTVSDPPAPADSREPATEPPAVNSTSNIAGNYGVSSANLTETGDMGQEYIDKIVFLGDSTTYGLRYYSMLSGGKDTMQVWTPTSGTLTLSYQSVATILYPETDTEITIREAVALKKPEYLVITLGVNGVSFMDETYFKSEYADLVRGIQQASPDTKIILQSIFPVASDYQYISSINNVKIAAANQWVIDIAEETGVRYLATASALIGDDGYLPHDYQNGDGLHLNTDSFTVVLNYIRTHGWQ